MRLGLTGRLVVATGVLALLVAGAFGVLLQSVRGEREASRLSRQSQEILVAANELERLVIDLETGHRGFVLTGDERFLEPWVRAQAAVPDVSRAITQLTVVPAQSRRAERIVEAVDSYVQDYSVPLVEAARQADPEARSVDATEHGQQHMDELRGDFDATEHGKQHMDALRADFDRFIMAERVLASSRQDDADDATRTAIMAATVGLVGSVALCFFFGGYLTRAIVRPVRRASTMAVRLAGGELSARMGETSAAELGDLERSFNTMANSLEMSHRELEQILDELSASRARVVAAADETRRRIERDLHDGAQQRLVSLGLELRALETELPPEAESLRGQLSHTAEGLAGVVEDLQEISRGIHPAILSRGGLTPALKTLARRSALPVELRVDIEHRLPQPIEVAAYYVVSEALTNAAKHAQASVVDVEVETGDGEVRLAIHDDGIGGADPRKGSGLIGLRDRVESLGGTIDVTSPANVGTTLAVVIPIDRPQDAERSGGGGANSR